MIKETFPFYSMDGTCLHAILWRPTQEPQAILQITHGMMEHMDRYHDFAQVLVHHGIVVAGFDLRGHGHNPGDPECATMGKGGWEASVQDMHVFFDHLDTTFPGLPHYMLGFSLGSFLLREYLGTYPDGIAGAVIAGPGQQPAFLLSIIMAIVKGQIKKAGFDSTTELVKQLSFGVYNNKFKPNRTIADWLCSDQEQLDGFLADPLCRKAISSGLFYQLLGSMKRTAKVSSYDSWNWSMPVLLLSGKCDPVGDMTKGTMLLCNTMDKAGKRNIRFYFLPDARHDLFHEISNGTFDLMIKLILDWMDLKPRT